MMEDFSTLTHVSPGLTDQLLTESLTDWFGEPTSFTHWEYVSETGKGDSYLSEVMRIKIHGKGKTGPRHVEVVLKTIPKNVARRLTFKSHEFFKNEIQFYTKVLPALLKFQSQKNLKDPFDNYAKIFLTYSDGVNDCICLEDVSLQNFGMAIRQKGIDVELCRITLKTFAKFHALSFAMKDQQRPEFDAVKDEIFETYYAERLRDWYQRFWNRISGIAIDAVEKEYPNSIYVDKIKEFAVPERYTDMIRAATTTLSTGVISHGDSWTNNFLYKYQGEVPCDAKMIDFQLTRCATPVLDISFFFYACTSQELREQHYDGLVDYYYQVLSSQIRDLGSDPDAVYSRELFYQEMKQYSYFGLAFSFESTPFIVLQPEDAVNMEIEGDQKVNIDDVWPVQPFKTKEGRRREANNVVHCVDRGFI